MKSSATGPSNSISAREATMQLGDPPSSVGARPKLPSGRWLRLHTQVVVARSLAPRPALWAAATALAPMERALILPDVRLASQPHACPHQDPLTALQAHCRGEVAPRQEATAISGLRTLGLCLAVLHASIDWGLMALRILQDMGRKASNRTERLGKGTARRALPAV